MNQFPEFTFFVYDHLGNTRVMYHNDMYDCHAFHTHYVLEHVLDYYPYGKTLREYLLDQERFETTYHERDIESGLDYRGARFYDGDVGRFLSTDPKAMEFAAWSTYIYTFDTPINLIDPDGRSPIPPPNDFFDTKGNYLGSDNREENNIRIVDPENSSTFNPNSADALLKSTHLSLTHMSEEAVGKIGKYYLSNGLGRNDIEVRGLYNASFPFMAVTQGDGTSEINSDGHMEFKSPVISISMTGGGNEHVTQGNLNNIYNFQNILYHETLHFNPLEITSSGSYRDVVPNGDVWKLNHVFIFHMMMSHPTYSKSTKAHQRNTRILMRREINLIEDSELKRWAKETFANDISEE